MQLYSKLLISFRSLVRAKAEKDLFRLHDICPQDKDLPVRQTFKCRPSFVYFLLFQEVQLRFTSLIQCCYTGGKDSLKDSEMQQYVMLVGKF